VLINVCNYTLLHILSNFSFQLYNTALRKYRKKANAKIINIADVPKCSDTFWEHPPPAGDAEVLPLNIAIDRAFDVQWNPPGYPTLEASWLQTPFGDDWGDYDEAWGRDGPVDHLGSHYNFVRHHKDGKLGMVREKDDGSLCSVFHEVAFISVSDDVLMMNGDPGPEGAYGGYAGGGFGTLIKGVSIPSGSEDGSWNTTTLEEYGESGLQWLLKNFATDEITTIATE